MIELPFWRRARAAAEPLPLAAGVSARELRAVFVERRRVTVDGVLPVGSADAIAQAVPGRNLVRRATSLQALSAGTPSYMFYEERLRPHRDCRRSCAPICRIADSLAEGALFELVRAITGRQSLAKPGTSLRVYVKGSHVDHDVATQPGIEVVCCGTEWDPAFGGQVRFGDDQPQPLRFGALHLREIRQGDASAVTLVTDHGPLVVLSAWMQGCGAQGI